jgi:ectoine hydroxylase-related dioxygenase (phytanoyl-CoA dioxygenase family)
MSPARPRVPPPGRYQHWWARGQALEWPPAGRELCAFYTFPDAIYTGLGALGVRKAAAIRLQFALFRLAHAACQFRTFNVQDEWSLEPAAYATEVETFRDSMGVLFPEVPWFERAAPTATPGAPALEVEASAAVEAVKAPRCLAAGAPAFSVRRRLLSQERMQELRQHTALLVDEQAAPGEAGYTPEEGEEPGACGRAPWRYYEHSNASMLSRLECFVPHSPFFRQLASELLDLACGADAAREYTLLKDKINFKSAGAAPFEPHQDITAGWGAYANRHFTIAVSLYDADVGSACMWFAPSPGHRLTPDRLDLSSDVLPFEAFRPVATHAGDAILFDSFVPHCSFTHCKHA